MAGGIALVVGGLVWVVYLGLEPFVRRRWPQVLVSWTRLLSGEWGDPLVGRDVVIGCATGVTAACLVQLMVLAPSWVGKAEGLLVLGSIDRFLPPGSFARGFLHSVDDAVFTSFLLFFLLCFLRMSLRDERLTAGLWVLMGVAVLSAINNSWVAAPIALMLFLVIYFVLMRVGFLAFLMGRFVAVILLMCPITFDRSSWYAGVGYAGLLVVAALTFYGFWTSLAGRPVFEIAGVED